MRHADDRRLGAQELEAIQRGGPAAAGPLRALLAVHRKMVLTLAALYARPGADAGGLVAEGVLGLLDAARSYDPGRDGSFATHAAWTVRDRIAACALLDRLGAVGA
jgi:DNA-directed RNA polymerase sigma subunit (sigma70/sigma32)